MGLERETKLVVSVGDYDRILAEALVVGCSHQLNVYYLDPDRMNEELGYFRVRFSSQADPVATLKLPVGWKGEMREMVEIERPLSELGPAVFPWPHRWIEIDPHLPEEFLGPLQALGLGRLRRLGWMRNHRCVVDLSPHGVIELDRTALPDGQVHYEVEIEHPEEAAHGALVKRVQSLAPSASFSRIGKVSRFLSAIRAGVPTKR